LSESMRLGDAKRESGSQWKMAGRKGQPLGYVSPMRPQSSTMPQPPVRRRAAANQRYQLVPVVHSPAAEATGFGKLTAY
jgi:hypothetical protein